MASVSQCDHLWMPLWARWIGGGWGCTGHVPRNGAPEKCVSGKLPSGNFHLSLLSFTTLYSSKLVFKKENTLGIYSQNSWLKIEGFPSVLISKPVLDLPRAERLSAIAITSDTCGYGKLLAAMGSAWAGAHPARAAVLRAVRAVSCLQSSETDALWAFLIL